MTKHNQNGAVNGLAISLIFVVLLLVGSIAFGAWAFSSRQDYKNNVQPKIASAVIVAKQQEDSAKDVQFAAAAKLPLKTYNGPETAGSIVVNYPKTWSGYVDDSGSDALVDGYFNPDVVPSISAQSSIFALRVQVLSQAYTDALASFSGQDGSTVVAYSLPKVPKVVGVEVTGTLDNNRTGTMVVLPLRNQTIEISTDGTQYLSDFNTYILPNFSFSP